MLATTNQINLTFCNKYYKTEYRNDEQIMELINSNPNLLKNVFDFKNRFNNFDLTKYSKETNKNIYDSMKHVCETENMNTSNYKTTKDINFKISVVMTTLNRKQQTINTLNDFEKRYAGNYDFEVIIVDDNSDENEKLNDIVNNYSFCIKLINITEEEKGDRANPCTAYNIGFKCVEGEFVIIQNPECFHIGDIFGHVITNMKENDYYVYSCYNVVTTDLVNEFVNYRNPAYVLNSKNFRKRNRQAMTTDKKEWYNHPIHRNLYYHHCSAIHKSKLDLIKGFDSRFSDGYWYDDDEIILTIKHNLKLNMYNLMPDNHYVVHQYHPKYLDRKTRNSQKLIEKNFTIFDEMVKYHENNKINYPKLFHVYLNKELTEDNYLSFESFIKQNKFWKIIIYLEWNDNTNKDNHFFNKITDYYNVSTKYVDQNQLNNILSAHGGIWGNFNEIYVENLDCLIKSHDENVVNLENNKILFKQSLDVINFI